jgi:ubiquinone/menaquinone biosynthesis C-methylase UbiE
VVLPKLYLPDRQHISPIDEEDPLKYYYLPLTSYVYRKRLQMAMTLLGEKHFRHLLEVGYGSGILLPTLAARCDALYGVDLHENVASVEAMLAAQGIQASLAVGNILNLNYPDGIFDAVTCLSVLEHLVPGDLVRALMEVHRVLRPGGVAVFGFPVRNVATSAFYKLVGFDPAELHPSGHREIVAAIRASFERAYVTWFPRCLPMSLALYVGVRGEC